MNKKIFVFIIMLVIAIIVSLILLNINTKTNEQINDTQVYLLQTSSMSIMGTENKFKYYDSNGKIFKEEKFRDKGDISYSCCNLNCIYSFGPGGLYETNIESMKTKKISDEDINIVKFYNNQMYYFVNNGFTSSAYSSKICTNDKSIDLDFFVVDFIIFNNKYYILGLDSLYIFEDNKQIKKIDISDLSVYQRILEIDNKAFLVNKASFYEINNDEIILFADNGIIKDLNFKTYRDLNNKQVIVDLDLEKILEIKLTDNSILLSDKLDFDKNLKISYSFESNNIIGYSVDYNTNKVRLNEMTDDITSEFNINLSKNESVFKVYKLK